MIILLAFLELTGRGVFPLREYSRNKRFTEKKLSRESDPDYPLAISGYFKVFSTQYAELLDFLQQFRNKVF